jgi:hemoglobin/transferrin/lactoferrin receptor protein
MDYFHKILLFLVSFTIINFNYSQTEISVLDGSSGEPIPSVLVFNKNQTESILTDNQGKFDLDIFKANDSIFFSHISYESNSFLFKDIKDKKIIYLNSSMMGLDEVVLSVGRNKQNLKYISRKVTLISPDDLLSNVDKTGAEILYEAGGIHVQKSQSGGGSPVIRGFEANRVLLVIDGVRMNNTIYRSGHLQNSITVDPNYLERIEVLYGPSSVSYGSDAIGGVVHYFTKIPEFSVEKEIDFKKKRSYNLTNKSKTRNYQLTTTNKNWALFSSLSISDYGDIIMGKNRKHGFEDWGLVNHFSENNRDNFFLSPSVNSDPNVQRNTAYDQKDFITKVNLKLKNDSNLILNFQVSRSSKINRFDKLSELDSNLDLKFAEWYYGPQKRTMLSSILNLSPSKLFDNGRFIFSYQSIGESRHKRKFGSEILHNQTEKLDIYSVNGDFSKTIINDSELLYGFEYTHNNLYSKSVSNRIDTSNPGLYLSEFKSLTRYPNDQATHSSLAGYFKYLKKINNYSNLNFGLRLSNNRVKLGWDFNSEEFLNNNINVIFLNQFERLNLRNLSLTGSFGYVTRILKNNKVSINLSSGYRSPNIDDISKIRENAGILLIPNTEIKPEKAYTIDLGWSNYSNDFNSSLNIYYTILDGTIGRDFFYDSVDETTPNTATIIYQNEEVFTMANYNLGQSKVYGFNYNIDLNVFKNIHLDGNITYTKGTKLSSGSPMPSIPPLFGDFKLKWKYSGNQLVLVYKFSKNKTANSYSLGGEDGLDETPYFINDSGDFEYLGMPKWAIFNISSIHKVKIFKRLIDLNFSIENLFDIHYKQFASGISSPGRSFNISAFFN